MGGNQELSSKKSVVWSWRRKVAEKMVVTAKRLEGGQRREERGFLSLSHPDS